MLPCGISRYTVASHCTAMAPCRHATTAADCAILTGMGLLDLFRLYWSAAQSAHPPFGDTWARHVPVPVPIGLTGGISPYSLKKGGLHLAAFHLYGMFVSGSSMQMADECGPFLDKSTHL